jgi:hypothetical protein
MGIVYIGKCRYEIQEQNKFLYGIPAHFEHWIEGKTLYSGHHSTICSL